MDNNQFFSARLVVSPQDKEANRLRILVPKPLDFYELFIEKIDEQGNLVKREDGTTAVTPYRKFKNDGLIPAEVKPAKDGDRQKYVSAYIVFNHSLQCLQIFSFHQVSIRDAVSALANEARLDGKTLADFDITILKTGDGSRTNTNYAIECDRQKGKIVYSEIEPEIVEFYKMMKNNGNINGAAIIRNEYPFTAEAAEPMPTDMKRISGLLTGGDGVTVQMLIDEEDADAAALIFRDLVKKCVDGVIVENGVEYTFGQLQDIRDEKICPF